MHIVPILGLKGFTQKHHFQKLIFVSFAKAYPTRNQAGLSGIIIIIVQQTCPLAVGTGNVGYQYIQPA